MTKEKPENAIELAAAHWAYIESVLRSHNEEQAVIEKCGFHYQQAFIHGYKHGQEDLKDENAKN